MPNIFDVLGLEGIEAEKISFIQKGLTDGLSGNAIQKALSASPLGGLKRQTLQSAIRILTNQPIARDYVKSVPNRNRINPLKLPADNYGHEKAYNYVIKATGINAAGEEQTQFVTISTDSFIPTKDQAIAEAMPLFFGEESNYPMETIDAVVDSVFTGSNYTGAP